MCKLLRSFAILAWGAAPGLFAQTADVAFRWAYLQSPAQPGSWVVADLRAPGNFSMSLHAGTQPEGTLRGRPRPTERINFQLQFNARNVVPPPANWEAASPSLATFYVLRREDGSVATANFLTTTSLRLPEPVKVLRIDIRRGDAAANGPDLLRYG